MEIKKIIKIMAAVVIIAAVLTGIYFYMWNQGAFLPGWVSWSQKNFTASVNNISYSITLNKKSLSISNEDKVIWTSKEGIKVQDALSCDIDGDSEDELVLLCWKIGRYGNAKPFWVEKDENKWSQHIFVYEYDGENISPKWMSSYLGLDIKKMDSELINSAKSRLVFTGTDDIISYFSWNSWGFEKQESEVSFCVFGDNLIHEPIYIYGLNNDESFSFLYKNVKDLISKSDISVINQETPLVDKPEMYSDYPRFGTPLNVGKAMVKAGFDVVTCATNHALDKGMYGIDTTKNFFDENNITCLGIQSVSETEYKPYEIITKNGIKIAMLNYTYGTNGIKIPDENKYAVHLLNDEARIKSDIISARENADAVIVFVHWGTENQTEPDEEQEKWKDVFLENDVDVVVGTHPHVLQPCEMLTGSDGHSMLVYYSIGNYISAQSEKSCTKGGVAQFKISATSSGYKVTDYSLTPLEIVSKGNGKFVAQLAP